MTSGEFIDKLKDIVLNYKTIYVFGGVGNPMTEREKKHFTECDWMEYNCRPDRREVIYSADDSIFGFDCSGLIKGILWGWKGDKTLEFGGAEYKSNMVPDLYSDLLFNECECISDDFSQIEPGEAVWMNRHIGIYIGNGLAVESTPLWKDGVQITACNCVKEGYNSRVWLKHGKLPYIVYDNRK